MTGLVLRSAGVVCVAAGLSLAKSAPARRVPARVDTWSRYDTSRSGRRLAHRLWRAQIDMTPTRWRCAQAVVAVPLLTLLAAAGVSPLTAAGVAYTAVRWGSAALLRLRRHRATLALDEAAPTIARGLATELAACGNGSQAIIACSRRFSTGGANRMASAVLDRAAAAVVLGTHASTALREAMEQTVPRLGPRSAAARVASLFALHSRDVAACATGLTTVARSLDDDVATAREVRATVAEVRMSATAVPAIAAATAALLFTSDPPALAAALSPRLVPFLGLAVVVIVAAVLVVRRLT